MRRLTCLLALISLASGAAAQGPTPERYAALAVATAWQEYERGDYAAARKRFGRVAEKFGNTSQASAARYGLGVSLSRVPVPNYAKAVEELRRPCDDGNFRQRPDALSLAGECRRQLGLKEANPQAAQQHFQQARNNFATARDLWRERDPQASARARCDHAEMQIRTGQYREARNECDPFLKDGPEAKGPWRDLGLYYYGLACSLDRDANARREASRPLMLLSPFDQPVFGLHAEYLVGRGLQAAGEEAEAAVHFETVAARGDSVRQDAAKQLQRGEGLATNPVEKSRLEALVRNAPDAVAGAAFQLAQMQAESGRTAEALDRFREFLTDYPDAELAPEARLRAALCHLELRQFNEASALMDGLKSEKEPLRVEVEFAQAQVRHARSEAGERKAATDAMRRAADRAGSDGNVPGARERQQQMRLELADALHTDGQFDEAARLYETLWNEQAFKGNRDEVLARLVIALGNAGKIDPAQYRGDEFRKNFPHSASRPAVELQLATNDFRRAVEWSKDRNRRDAVRQKLAEASAEFKSVAEMYPDDPAANLAHFGRGDCEARLNHFPEAAASYAAIPAEARTGELARTDLALADSMLQIGPDTPLDATQTAQRLARLNEARGLLVRFLDREPASSDVPDAVFRLGVASEKIAAILPPGPRRDDTVARARDAYTRLNDEFPNHPLATEGAVALAAIPAVTGDTASAIRELRTYESDAKKRQSRAAPMAMARLGALLRNDDRAIIAAELLKSARERYHDSLQKEKSLAIWATLLKYQHALSLTAAGDWGEARKLFEEIKNAGDDRPLAAAAAIGVFESRQREGENHVEAGETLMTHAGRDNTKRNVAQREIDRGRNSIRESANQLYDRANQLRNRVEPEERATMYAAAAWGWRRFAADELAKVTVNLRANQQREWLVDAARSPRDEQRAGNYIAPPVTATPVPWIDPENRAMECYRRLIEESPESPQAMQARLEVAQWATARGDTATALESLQSAIEAPASRETTSSELMDRVRLTLGDLLLASDEAADAAAVYATVAVRGGDWALAAADRRGAALLAAGKPRDAIVALARVFDAEGRLAKNGMLRYGVALLAEARHDEAAETFARHQVKFGPSTAAAFGLASVSQARREYAAASEGFQAIVAAGGDLAALARFRIGQCRHALRKYDEAAAAYLSVPFTPGVSAELTHAARIEAARAFAESGNSRTAADILLRVALEAPADSVWANAAAERLVKLPRATP